MPSLNRPPRLALWTGLPGSSEGWRVGTDQGPPMKLLAPPSACWISTTARSKNCVRMSRKGVTQLDREEYTEYTDETL